MNIFRQTINQNTKKTLVITTLSPLNIGNGDKYANLDYYIEDGKAKIIDIEKMMEGITDINKINEMQQELIKSNMGNNKMTISVRELYEGIGLYPDEFISKEIDCKIKKDASVQVAKFINQNGNYYIPGSSLKGAIRTAYIFDYYDKRINKLVEILEYNKKAIIHNNKIKKEKLKKSYKRLKNIEHEISGLNNYFQNIIVADSNILIPENFEFIETRRYNTHYVKKYKNGYGNKNKYKQKIEGTPEYKEVLKTNSNFKMELTIKKDFPKNFEEIKNMCNEFSRTIIKFEMENKYLSQDLKDFYKNKILNNLNKDNSFYLALGSGSGFLSKTIYLLLWKHKKDLNTIKRILPLKKVRGRVQAVNDYLDFPRTRTIDVNKKIPLGWVKIMAK